MNSFDYQLCSVSNIFRNFQIIHYIRKYFWLQ